jgi:hypothetical protein
VEKHLIPYFGDMDISKIRYTDIQKFLNDVSHTYAAESAKKMSKKPEQPHICAVAPAFLLAKLSMLTT